MKTLATTVARLREWAEVESVPAQDEFDAILADLEMLVRQEKELGEETHPASLTPPQIEMIRMLACALKTDLHVDQQTRIMAGALHQAFVREQ